MLILTPEVWWSKPHPQSRSSTFRSWSRLSHFVRFFWPIPTNSRDCANITWKSWGPISCPKTNNGLAILLKQSIHRLRAQEEGKEVKKEPKVSSAYVFLPTCVQTCLGRRILAGMVQR